MGLMHMPAEEMPENRNLFQWHVKMDSINI
jgi:hypothetical protein